MDRLAGNDAIAYCRSMALFTANNAAEMGRRSAEARKLYKSTEGSANYADVLPSLSTENPLGRRLMRVQDRLVDQMNDADDPKAISALAQALRHVRETYHLVTGQAKPGVLKTDQSKRRQPAPQVAIEVDTEPVPPPKTPPEV